MANRENDVFAVLATSGNQNILAAGNTVGNLLPGQIGIFDYDSGEVPGSGVIPKRFFLAVGIDRTASGTLEDLRQSAGQFIARNLVNGYGFAPYSASRKQILEVTDIAARCDRDYALKIQLQNTRISQIQGQTQFSETFSVRGACCPDCGDDEGCTQADANDVVVKLVNEINMNQIGIRAYVAAGLGNITGGTEPTADGNLTLTFPGETPLTIAILNADNLAGVATKIRAAVNAVTTSAYRAGGTGAAVTLNGPAGDVTFSAGATGYVATIVDPVQTEVPIATIEDYLAANPTAVLALRIEASAVPASPTVDINLHYYKLRETFMIVSLVDGFNCSGTVTEVQGLAYEQGNGTDIRMKEYDASAWAGSGPYVASDLLSLSKGNVEYLAVNATKYDQFTIEYTERHGGGWLEYENTLATYIAIPQADTVTRNAFAAKMDEILGDLGFDDLADDAAAASTSATVVEPAITDPDLDGLG